MLCEPVSVCVGTCIIPIPLLLMPSSLSSLSSLSLPPSLVDTLAGTDALVWGLQRHLKKRFGKHVKVSESRDKDHWQSLDVVLSESGRILHSKRLVAKDNWGDMPKEREALGEKIHELLVNGGKESVVDSMIVAERRPAPVKKNKKATTTKTTK